MEFAEAEDAALGAGGDFDDFAFGVVGADGLAGGPEVEAVYGFVVLTDVVVALGAAGMVIEGDAGADDVDEGGALVGDGALTSGTSWPLSPLKLRATRVAPIIRASLTVSMAESLLVDGVAGLRK